jgi:hypothetical protein
LTFSQVGALTTAQFDALESADLSAILTANIKAINPENFVGMSTDDIKALSPNGLPALDIFTASQLNSMTTEQRAATPLVLDLNGDGVHTTSLLEGVTFDILNNGSRIRTGWVDANDGLLVRDLNGNGSIDSSAELFGDSTVLPNGTKAVNGFQALAALDTDHNGEIDANDRAFNDLQVWQDVNQDGLSQSDELHSLEELSIKSLSLGFTPVSQDDAGNWIGLESTYQQTDEEFRKLVDVWFKLS